MTKKREQERRENQRRAEQERRTEKGEEIYQSDTPQEVTSTRAKSDRHKKVTSENWNQ